jgi:hypothetical protein
MIDDKDSGLLYLTPNEADLLLDIMQRGAAITGDTVISDIYSDNCFDEADSWEVVE